MNKWVPAVLSCALCFPAHAQFFPVAPPVTAPALPATTVSAADLARWQTNLEAAKAAADKAATNGDTKSRDAAIQDAATWATKIFDPFGVSASAQLKAFEVIGALAHEMVEWKVDFGVTKLGMVDVRSGDLIKAATPAERARLLGLRADLSISQDYDYKAFEDFEAILDIPEASPALVKYAVLMGISIAPTLDHPKLKPFYDRVVTFEMTPQEKSGWTLKRQLYIIDNEVKGDDRDAALKAVKAIIDDPQTPAVKRDELAHIYGNTVFGEEKKAFIEQMIGAFNANPAIQANWIHSRGMQKAADKDWPGAVADYRAAAKTAPSGSADHDQFVFDAATVAMQYAAEKTAVVPEFESLLPSTTLTLDQRYEAAFRLFVLAFSAQDFKTAKQRIIAARTVAGEDVLLQAKSNVYLARADNELGETAAAVAVWKAIPLDKLSYTGTADIRKNVQFDMKPVGIELYSSAAASKNYTLAQSVLDYSTANSLFDYGDQKLLDVDILARQGKFDDAIAMLKKFGDQVSSPSDKKMIADGVANLEKQKADSEKKSKND